MKKIFDAETIKACLAKSRYHSVLEDLQIDLCLIQYEKGELVTAPFQEESLFQIVIQGSLNIYFVRNDGERYSLSAGGADSLLGDMEIFCPQNDNTCTEAAETLLCLAFPIAPNREILLANCEFLQMIGNSLSAKLAAITTMDAAPSSLTERVLSYMQYRCDNGVLKGLEQGAFHLHCSPRQLQRILNQCENAGAVEKIGKGTYKLIMK